MPKVKACGVLGWECVQERAGVDSQLPPDKARDPGLVPGTEAARLYVVEASVENLSEWLSKAEAVLLKRARCHPDCTIGRFLEPDGVLVGSGT